MIFLGLAFVLMGFLYLCLTEEIRKEDEYAEIQRRLLIMALERSDAKHQK